MSSDFYFQNFFPKNLAKKLGRVLQWRISGTARVRVRFCSTPPPFRADENTRGSFLPPASGRRSGGGLSFRPHSGSVPAARANSSGCSVRNHEFQSAEVLPISPTTSILAPDSLPCHISATLDPP